MCWKTQESVAEVPSALCLWFNKSAWALTAESGVGGKDCSALPPSPGKRVTCHLNPPSCQPISWIIHVDLFGWMLITLLLPQNLQILLDRI